jgi:hypothetical protein
MLQQRLAKARRLGRSRIALRRLELLQLARRLPNAPVIAVLARLGPAPALWSPAFWRHWRFSRHTGGTWALAWLVPAWKCCRWWDAHAGNGGYDGIARARTWYTRLWKLPTHAALATEWRGRRMTRGVGSWAHV